jgi:hypothetical protein
MKITIEIADRDKQSIIRLLALLKAALQPQPKQTAAPKPKTHELI